jgi:hypothetical protein
MGWGIVSRIDLMAVRSMLVIAALVALVVISARAPEVLRWWPLLLTVIGVIGMLRQPRWVASLRSNFGPRVASMADVPRRVFSLLLICLGMILLPITVGLVEARYIVGGGLIALGVLFIWHRLR